MARFTRRTVSKEPPRGKGNFAIYSGRRWSHRRRARGVAERRRVVCTAEAGCQRCTDTEQPRGKPDRRSGDRHHPEQTEYTGADEGGGINRGGGPVQSPRRPFTDHCKGDRETEYAKGEIEYHEDQDERQTDQH